MANKIEEAYAAHISSAHSMDEPSIVRLQVKIEHAPALAWLTAQKSPVKTYWSDRENGFEMAGIGAADIVASEDGIDFHTLFARLHKLITADNEDLRYYGGFRFSEKDKSVNDTAGDAGDTLWEKFGSCRFVIPRFELFRQSDETHLVCNIVFGKETCEATGILAELGDVVSFIDSRPTEVPRIIARSDNPEKGEWNAVVRAALKSFATEELEKLVLARQTSFEFSGRLDALQLLEKLKRATPDCYHYCFQLGDSVAFIGASPERLYQRNGRYIKSEAVAGTRPRGLREGSDKALARELLSSDKELREHQYVVQGVREALEQLCRSVHSDSGVSLLKLARLQHLITRFEGALGDGTSDADILGVMHPTPAVGGYPASRAVERINGLEPFNRGWYAGPVGWVGYDAAEFAVGIRSGLVDDNKLHLFAGAGVVEGSTPEAEWSEIEDKVRNFIKVLTE